MIRVYIGYDNGGKVDVYPQLGWTKCGNVWALLTSLHNDSYLDVIESKHDT